MLNRWARHTEYRGLSMDVLNGVSKNVKFFETTPKTRCPKSRNHSGLGLVGISKNRQRRIFRDCQKNAAVHGIKEPRDSRGIDSTGMVFRGMQDFLPAFADFSRASPYDFTHVALTLPLGMSGEVFGLLQTEHSGIGVCYNIVKFLSQWSRSEDSTSFMTASGVLAPAVIPTRFSA